MPLCGRGGGRLAGDAGCGGLSTAWNETRLAAAAAVRSTGELLGEVLRDADASTGALNGAAAPSAAAAPRRRAAAGGGAAELPPDEPLPGGGAPPLPSSVDTAAVPWREGERERERVEA